ncbi:FAH family protein, partial [Pseudomonas sp. SIMBA_044]
MRLVQFELNNGERRVGVVTADQVREVQGASSVRDLA